MDITAFFQQSAGKWASQRSNHYLVQNQSEGAKSELMVDLISQDDPAIVQLCQQQQVDPTQVLCSLKMSWSGIVDRYPKPQTGSSLMVVVADANQGTNHGTNHGKLISQTNRAEPVVGRYSLDADEILTLITEQPDFYAEERLWFANPNFRLRTSVVKRAGSHDVASFCSEIRLGGVPPAAQPKTAEASS